MKQKFYNKEGTLHVGEKIKVQVSVFIFEEDGQWVAYCPVLELSSYGENEKETKKSFEDAIDIFITETTKNSSLEKSLLKLGWTLKQHPEPMYEPPATDGEYMFKKNPTIVYNERVSIPI